MSFKDWCSQQYGISGITEGKIINSFFIPALPNTSINLAELAKQGGYQYIHGNINGLAISVSDFFHFNNYLMQLYQSTPRSEPWEQFQSNYFYSVGLNLSQQTEYKPLPSMHFSFQNPQAQQNFYHKFAQFQPRLSNNRLIPGETIEMPNQIITALKNEYYQQLAQGYRSNNTSESLQNQINQLQEIKTTIQMHGLQKRLDEAQYLALDYTNTYNLKEFEASSAFALSLRAFAEINRDNLSFEQYQLLLHTAHLLASYDAAGALKQSLKTDANLVNFLRKLIWQDNSVYQPLVSQLPREQRDKILDLINQNTLAILYGQEKVPLGHNAFFHAQRFLPDKNGRSETNEIIFQSGKMIDHSAFFRLIKVGAMANGRPAQLNETPHHYDYYKVEHNLGAQGHMNADYTFKGAHITKLQPSRFHNGQLIIDGTIDPARDPETYQKAMQTTLTELIKTERYLCLYRSPLTASLNSDEAREWTRLKNLSDYLSGLPITTPVRYFAHSKAKANLAFSIELAEMKAFPQEGGSCAIFSMRALVASVIGLELAALHSHFMQNGGNMVALIDEKTAYLWNNPPKSKTWGFFDNKPQDSSSELKPIPKYKG